MLGPMMPERSGWIVAHRAWGKMEAEVIKGRLESAGIPVLLDYESAGPAIGIIIDGLGEVRMLVPAQYVQDARLLLTQACGEDSDEPLPD